MGIKDLFKKKELNNQVNNISETDEIQINEMETKETKDKKKGIDKKVLFIAGGIGIVSLIGISFLFLSSDNKNKKPNYGLVINTNVPSNNMQLQSNNVNSIGTNPSSTTNNKELTLNNNNTLNNKSLNNGLTNISASSVVENWNNNMQSSGNIQTNTNNLNNNPNININTNNNIQQISKTTTSINKLKIIPVMINEEILRNYAKWKPKESMSEEHTTPAPPPNIPVGVDSALIPPSPPIQQPTNENNNDVSKPQPKQPLIVKAIICDNSVCIAKTNFGDVKKGDIVGGYLIQDVNPYGIVKSDI